MHFLFPKPSPAPSWPIVQFGSLLHILLILFVERVGLWRCQAPPTAGLLLETPTGKEKWPVNLPSSQSSVLPFWHSPDFPKSLHLYLKSKQLRLFFFSFCYSSSTLNKCSNVQLCYLNTSVLLHILESGMSIFTSEIKSEKWLFLKNGSVLGKFIFFRLYARILFILTSFLTGNGIKENLLISGGLYVIVMDILILL